MNTRLLHYWMRQEILKIFYWLCHIHDKRFVHIFYDSGCITFFNKEINPLNYITSKLNILFNPPNIQITNRRMTNASRKLYITIHCSEFFHAILRVYEIFLGSFRKVDRLKPFKKKRISTIRYDPNLNLNNLLQDSICMQSIPYIS